MQSREKELPLRESMVAQGKEAGPVGAMMRQRQSDLTAGSVHKGRPMEAEARHGGAGDGASHPVQEACIVLSEHFLCPAGELGLSIGKGLFGSLLEIAPSAAC